MKKILTVLILMFVVGIVLTYAQATTLTEEKLFSIIGRMHVQIQLLQEENQQLKGEVVKLTPKPTPQPPAPEK